MIDEYAILYLLTTTIMSLFRSPHSQGGNDVPHRNSSNNKLLLSIVGSDGQVQYAAIAIPESYAVNGLIPPYLTNPLLIGDYYSLELHRPPTTKPS